MPTHFLARVIWKVKDDSPKNQFVINPCFREQRTIGALTGPDWQGLATDLCTGINGWQGSPSKNTTVKLYTLDGPLSGPPKATAQLNPNSFWDLFCPPQMAATLSFYGAENVKSRRGRLYINPGIAGTAAAQVASQTVDASVRTKIGTLAPIFAGLGGINVDWIVWSRVLGEATKVQNWWVDDSWDVIRSRKLLSAVRTTGTTGG